MGDRASSPSVCARRFRSAVAFGVVVVCSAPSTLVRRLPHQWQRPHYVAANLQRTGSLHSPSGGAARRGAAWCLQRRVALQRVRERVDPLHCIALHCRVNAAERLSLQRGHPGRAGPLTLPSGLTRLARTQEQSAARARARSLARARAGRGFALVCLFGCLFARLVGDAVRLQRKVPAMPPIARTGAAQYYQLPISPVGLQPNPSPARPRAAIPSAFPSAVKTPGVRP